MFSIITIARSKHASEDTGGPEPPPVAPVELQDSVFAQGPQYGGPALAARAGPTLRCQVARLILDHDCPGAFGGDAGLGSEEAA
jgi:hypothetical protein